MDKNETLFCIRRQEGVSSERQGDNKGYYRYVPSAGIELEFKRHGATGDGKMRDVLKKVVEELVGGVVNRVVDEVVDRVVELVCREGFLNGPKLITFQSEEPELEDEEDEEEEEAVSMK